MVTCLTVTVKKFCVFNTRCFSACFWIWIGKSHQLKLYIAENWIFNLGDFLGVMKKRWDLWFLERNKNYCFTWSLYTYLNLLTRKNLRSISRNFMACKKHNFRSILGLSFFILKCWPKVVGQYLQVWKLKCRCYLQSKVKKNSTPNSYTYYLVVHHW